MVLSAAPARLDVTKSRSSILDAADRAEPAIRRAMSAALDAVEAAIPNLESMIASGDITAVVEAVHSVGVPEGLMSAIVDATASATAAAASSDAASFGIAFNQVNEKAVEWATAHAAEDITLISQATRVVVEEIIEEAIIRGISPKRAARQIEKVVPLLPQHQKSIVRQVQGMRDAGLDESHIAKIEARRARKLKRYRAEMIARTESVKAANMGQQLLWEQALDLDLIAPGTKKIWVATGDERTCKICAPMDGQVVSIVQPYQVTHQATSFTRVGSTFKVAGLKPLKGGGPSMTPPAHPNCRCTMILETIEAPGQAPPEKPVMPERYQAKNMKIHESAAGFGDDVLEAADQAVGRINATKYGDEVRVTEIRSTPPFDDPVYDTAFASVGKIEDSDDYFLYVNPRYADSMDDVGAELMGYAASDSSIGPGAVYGKGIRDLDIPDVEKAAIMFDRAVTHEYGHAAMRGIGGQVDGTVQAVTAPYYRHIGDDEVGYLAQGWPSLYAAESPSEFFAEAFADVVHFGDEASDLAKEAMRSFDDAFARLVGDIEDIPTASWTDFGAKLPRDPARRALIEDGLNLALASVPPDVRERITFLLGRFDGGINMKAATKSTKTLRELGKVTQRVRGGALLPGRKLTMHMSRPSPEWDDWVTLKNAKTESLRKLTPSGRWAGEYQDGTGEILQAWTRDHPEPEKWRLATPDEFADTLVHEMTHAEDFEQAVETGHKSFRGGAATKKVTQELRDEVWIMRYGGDRDWQHSGIAHDPAIRDAYEYATSESVEMVAELGRFYHRGVPDLGLTPESWRTQNPILAQWVEEVLHP